MSILDLFLGGSAAHDLEEIEIWHLGRVAADGSRCIQCGVCGYNCPVGIDVRSYARQALPVTDSSCITCGQCIQVCPRGTLRWEQEVIQND